ncbi:hypothetical protein DCAR_0314096 [Daucus carota subsp. sativus]|uniref:F-box domain-containing protein n=2 Tax=Daucus carota subsp. sativus TaxID=79200 RepID=A0AAF1ATT7_DAUCS|nr:PREDICTED: putative F-box protein At1g47790 [Daucus carota subsp. sativus]WOG94799.1 hypothetical protein DCAR_0314096 [Daucus carota subsp. sativus]
MPTYSTNYLPEELVIKILSSLPVKYVLRCKLVCKLWLSITLDPDFIRTHLKFSQQRPSVLAEAVYYDMQGSSYEIVSMISNSFEDSVNVPLPSSYSDPDHISSSCNGLVCLNDYNNSNIYIWNPSTRQGKELPRPKIQDHYMVLICIGFYFDSVSKDYKILRLVFAYPRKNARQTRSSLRVEIYSTKSDSWSEIQVEDADISSVNYGRNIGGVTSGPVIKGVLYMTSNKGLISFRLNKRVLKRVPLPSNFKINYETEVFEYEGCAALILYHNNEESLSLWTLDDDDDNWRRGIWTQKLNLEGDIRMNWSSKYFGVGQLVAWKDHRTIIMYDYNKKEAKEHRLQLPSNWYIDSFFRHTESLISLEGFVNGGIW